jgi:hypothetical protein
MWWMVLGPIFNGYYDEAVEISKAIPVDYMQIIATRSKSTIQGKLFTPSHATITDGVGKIDEELVELTKMVSNLMSLFADIVPDNITTPINQTQTLVKEAKVYIATVQACNMLLVKWCEPSCNKATKAANTRELLGFN